MHGRCDHLLVMLAVLTPSAAVDMLVAMLAVLAALAALARTATAAPKVLSSSAGLDFCTNLGLIKTPCNSGHKSTVEGVRVVTGTRVSLLYYEGP